MDSLSVWSAEGWGYHDLLCDYWTSVSAAHPDGVCFKNGHGSDKLTETLGFIMMNQDQFTRPADEGRNGLVLIDPPGFDEKRKEAVTWMNQVRRSNRFFSAAH